MGRASVTPVEHRCVTHLYVQKIIELRVALSKQLEKFFSPDKILQWQNKLHYLK